MTPCSEGGSAGCADPTGVLCGPCAHRRWFRRVRDPTPGNYTSRQAGQGHVGRSGGPIRTGKRPGHMEYPARVDRHPEADTESGVPAIRSGGTLLRRSSDRRATGRRFRPGGDVPTAGRAAAPVHVESAGATPTGRTWLSDVDHPVGAKAGVRGRHLRPSGNRGGAVGGSLRDPRRLFGAGGTWP